jgi:ribonucleoside-diphosphate reductase alpha chain
MMADAKFMESYSRFDEDKGRYETWEEAVDRVMKMHHEFYADVITTELEVELEKVSSLYKDKRVVGAQRALQFGGSQLLNKHMRMYNCSATYIDRPAAFSEVFWSGLCGAGVGISVQKHHISNLPKIKKRTKHAKIYLVPDSVEGWADALAVLMSSFFDGGGTHPEFEGRRVFFDTSDIRPKGAMISGGFKAPGPGPLDRALRKIEHLLTNITKEHDAVQLEPIQAFDAIMHAADAVIAGGVRRAAIITLFSPDDDEMAKSKTGNWVVDNKQRGRSNNSALLVRDDVTKEEFDGLFESLKQFGEPGFIFGNDVDYHFNPCLTGDSVVNVKRNCDDEMMEIRLDELCDVYSEYQALSYNIDNGVYEYKDITNGARTRSNAVVMELEMENGSKLKLTPDHLVLTKNRGYVEAGELIMSDDIVTM